MDITLARFVTLFQIFCLIFATVTSAPTRHEPHDACADVRNSALEFNQKAKDAAKSGPKGIKTFSTSLSWMEAQDMCDPGTLRHTPEPCIKKMLDVLTSYKSFVKIVAEFESCPVAHKVSPVLQQLHEDMYKCVRSRTEYHHHKAIHVSEHELQALETWEKKLLCQYTMERLFSFSILTARVFSVGDPVNHAEPTSPNCGHRN